MNTQPTLPFPIDSSNIMSPRAAREVGTQKTRLFELDIENIEIRGEFNYRVNWDELSEEEWEKKLEIPELANGIFESNGPDEPLLGDMLKNGKFYVTEGERRTRAIRLLIRQERGTYPNGNPVSKVEVLLNPPTTTELERVRRIITSGMSKLQLSQRQIAMGWLRDKERYELSDEAMAKLFNCSRATINNYILAASKFPVSTWVKIEHGESTMSKELDKVRAPKKTATVDLESGELIDQPIQTIPELTAPGENVDRLDQERVKHENKEAFEKEKESRTTDPNFKESRSKADQKDVLGQSNDDDQVVDGIMDIEQAIKKLDKLNVMVGHLPDANKQAMADMEGIIVYTQSLLNKGLEKIKTAASSK